MDVAKLSGAEDDVSSNGSASPVAVPKKRGRPATNPGKPKIVTVGKENGEKRGRGRPPKGSKKKHPTITATGKGRGRPKRELVVEEDDQNEENDDEGAADSDDNTQIKKARPGKSPKKGRGRPKREQNSEDESSDEKVDDDEEKHPVGRPPASGVNLNISRTGRGQGRPKKEVVAKKTSAEKANGTPDSGLAKKRGRPSKGGSKSPPYQPTGKARGRPKSAATNNKDDDEEEEEEEEEDCVDGKEDDEADVDEKDDEHKSDAEVESLSD